MDRTFENGRANAILRFLDSESTGMGDTLRLAETYPALDSSGQRATGENFAYLVYVPWSRLRQLLSGIGGDAEPVVAQQYPSGQLRVVGSRRVMRYIDMGIKRG